jgi:hypothetical protein
MNKEVPAIYSRVYLDFQRFLEVKNKRLDHLNFVLTW